MRKYLLRVVYFLFAFVGIPFSGVFASTRDLLRVEGGENSANDATDVKFEQNILVTVQDYLLGAYVLVAIGMLLFMGFKLISAKGNEEEFKNAGIALVYVLIGLTIPPLSYVAVRIVTGLNF